MTEIAGVDMKDLDEILYTLEDTDMDMMEGISKVARMLKDYISCLLLDRFEGYDNEKDLEKAASSLAAENNLLAGKKHSYWSFKVLTCRCAFKLRRHLAKLSLVKQYLHFLCLIL